RRRFCPEAAGARPQDPVDPGDYVAALRIEEPRPRPFGSGKAGTERGRAPGRRRALGRSVEGRPEHQPVLAYGRAAVPADFGPVRGAIVATHPAVRRQQSLATPAAAALGVKTQFLAAG